MKILYSKSDGNVEIVSPYPDGDEAALNRAMAALPVGALNPVAIDASVIPLDRSKRLAWRQIGLTIVIDSAVSADLSSRLARTTTDESERLSGKADSAIMLLINQTKAEWITWVTANLSFCVTAADRNRMGTLFWIVSIAVRRLVRNGG